MANKKFEKLMSDLLKDENSKEKIQDDEPLNVLELAERLEIMSKAIKSTFEFKKDTKNPKLTIHVYGDRVELKYAKIPIEHKAAAAKNAISTILDSIKDKKVREGIIACACRETKTFDD